MLVEHNMEGQATVLWGTLVAAGWLDMVPPIIEQNLAYLLEEWHGYKRKAG